MSERIKAYHLFDNLGKCASIGQIYDVVNFMHSKEDVIRLFNTHKLLMSDNIFCLKCSDCGTSFFLNTIFGVGLDIKDLNKIIANPIASVEAVKHAQALGLYDLSVELNYILINSLKWYLRPVYWYIRLKYKILKLFKKNG